MEAMPSLTTFRTLLAEMSLTHLPESRDDTPLNTLFIGNAESQKYTLSPNATPKTPEDFVRCARYASEGHDVPGCNKGAICEFAQSLRLEKEPPWRVGSQRIAHLARLETLHSLLLGVKE